MQSMNLDQLEPFPNGTKAHVISGHCVCWASGNLPHPNSHNTTSIPQHHPRRWSDGKGKKGESKLLTHMVTILLSSISYVRQLTHDHMTARAQLCDSGPWSMTISTDFWWLAWTSCTFVLLRYINSDNSCVVSLTWTDIDLLERQGSRPACILRMYNSYFLTVT